MNITATLLAQMVAFVLLIVLVNKVMWGPMSKMLADRQKRIADGLAAGDKGRQELELAEKRAAQILGEAKSKSQEILAQAEKRKTELEEEGRVKGHAEYEKAVTAARAEIERETHRVREQLRGQVATLATAGAGRILKREIDANAHEALLNDVVAQI